MKSFELFEAAMELDSKKYKYQLHYKCPDCKETWSKESKVNTDDECPKCGTVSMPKKEKTIKEEMGAADPTISVSAPGKPPVTRLLSDLVNSLRKITSSDSVDIAMIGLETKGTAKILVNGVLLTLVKESVNESVGNEFITSVKKDIKLRSGAVIAAGTKVRCEFSPDSSSTFRVFSTADKPMRMPYTAASNYLNGFKKEPSMAALEKYSNDGICPTPLGARVEPDGHGPHGEPSWIIIMLGI